MKKVISAVLIVLMTIGIFSACEADVSNQSSGKISIVCTTFAAYDWTRAIVGNGLDRFEITLLGNGVDLHSFQPTAQDIAKIHMADLFVQIGGTTEDWTNDLDLEDNKKLKLFDLLDNDEKIFNGADHTKHKHSENEFDEHIWLSLRLAQRMADAISERLCDLDKSYGVEYQKNCAQYVLELKNLDEEYIRAVQNSKDRTVIFADRFPFAYLMQDYDIICLSAFDGCSSDTNANFDTITNLSTAVEKFDKDTVLVLENSAQSVADPLKAALNDKVIEVEVMDSCQVIDADNIQNIRYIDTMKQNLKSLKKALR